MKDALMLLGSVVALVGVIYGRHWLMMFIVERFGPRLRAWLHDEETQSSNHSAPASMPEAAPLEEAEETGSIATTFRVLEIVQCLAGALFAFGIALLLFWAVLYHHGQSPAERGSAGGDPSLIVLGLVFWLGGMLLAHRIVQAVAGRYPGPVWRAFHAATTWRGCAVQLVLLGLVFGVIVA